MDSYKDDLVVAGVPNLYGQENVLIENVSIYWHIRVVWLEGGEYHAFITELDSATNIAFGYVSWQANEWGYINLDEYKTLPILLQETFHWGRYTYQEMMKYLEKHWKL